jgi:hypothetical protein
MTVTQRINRNATRTIEIFFARDRFKPTANTAHKSNFGTAINLHHSYISCVIHGFLIHIKTTRLVNIMLVVSPRQTRPNLAPKIKPPTRF